MNDIRGDAPEVRYAKSGDVNIAYAVVGDGPFDVVFVSGWVLSNLEGAWDGSAVDLFKGMASFSRPSMCRLACSIGPATRTHPSARGVTSPSGSPAPNSSSSRGLITAGGWTPVKSSPRSAAFLSASGSTGEWDLVETERVLATVLFTDIVGSTAKLTELGDRQWRELLQQHHALVRRQIVRFRGREIDTAGDGFFASFDGPARAIRCALAITDAVREIGLDVRAGLHTGECEITDSKMGGIAVHIGARVAAQAGPGEVLVSSTVKDLVAGSGIRFRDRGFADLKGVPGEWRLYAVEHDAA